MIFVLAGTLDGREIVGKLLAAGYSVIASVVSRYGKELLAKYGAEYRDKLKINDEALDEAELADFLRHEKITTLVDASHPYAVNVSRNAIEAAKKLNINYLRYERSLSELDYENIHVVTDYQAAGEMAAKLGKNIFLTTGSRNLEKFTENEALVDCHLIARVLPTADVIEKCTVLGFSPADIVALQGPFSTALNKELYKKYQAEVIITKNSGEIGGTDTKISAAKEMNLPVVIIDRPVLDYPNKVESIADIVAFVESINRG